MNILEKLRRKSEPTIAVVITADSSVRVRLADGTITDAGPGERLTLGKREAETLIAQGDARWIPTTEEKIDLDRRASVIPPPVDPRPIPEGWDKLPPCFAKWWALAERGRCLRLRQIAIEGALLRRRGLTEREIADYRQDSGTLPEETLRGRVIGAWLERNPINAGVLDGEQLDVLRRLSNALASIGKDIDDFAGAHGQELIGLEYEIAGEALRVHSDLAKVSRELSDTGFAIFKARVAALGVNESLIRQWFGASADCLKYEHPVDSPPLASLGIDPDTGESITVVNAGPRQIASWIPRWIDETKRLTALLKEAKTELSRTTKAAGAPLALPS